MKIVNIDLNIKIIPNLLTIFRIFSIPVILFSIINHLYFISSIAFIISAITDFLDGFIARRYSVQSKSGRIMDALADKFLTISVAWTLFFMTHQLSLIFIIAITGREAIVTLMRLFYPNFRNKSSSNIAKWKTFIFYLLLGTVLISNIPIFFAQQFSAKLLMITFLMEIVVLSLSLISLINYLLLQMNIHVNE